MALSGNSGGVITFSALPNELKLLFADNLQIADVNALVRTSSAANRLLTRYMYSRAIVERSKRGTPFFHTALKYCCLAAARMFVELGADVNMREFDTVPRGSCGEVKRDEHVHPMTNVASGTNNAGRTPLQIAIRADGREDHEPIVRLLIDAGADTSASSADFRSALETAVWDGGTQIAQLLLDQGTDPNAVAQGGEPLLNLSVIRRHPALVKLLLGAGVDVQTADIVGWSALHWAAFHGDGDIVEALLKSGADVQATDTFGNTPLLVAVHYRGMQSAAYRLLDRARSHRRALRRAKINANRAHASLRKEQIQLFPGVAPDVLQPYPRALPTDRVIELLLAAGADIWVENRQNYSAILWAVYWTLYVTNRM